MPGSRSGKHEKQCSGLMVRFYTRLSDLGSVRLDAQGEKIQRPRAV